MATLHAFEGIELLMGKGAIILPSCTYLQNLQINEGFDFHIFMVIFALNAKYALLTPLQSDTESKIPPT